MKTIKELMQEYNLTIKEFSDFFEIPYRTVQKWERGERTPAEYLVKLMIYKLEKEAVTITVKGGSAILKNMNISEGKPSSIYGIK